MHKNNGVPLIFCTIVSACPLLNTTATGVCPSDGGGDFVILVCHRASLRASFERVPCLLHDGAA
jgi:hypothetical protein